jgi:dienelactone hydrolase
MRTEKLIYDGPGGPFEGTLRFVDDGRVKPGVLVAHAFGGQSTFEDEKAAWLAERGYVGFAIDLYGRGVRARSPDEAKALMATLDGDRALLAARMQASLAALVRQPQVDPSRLAAIGFCFGGKCVLDLARSGAAVRGVASFHGLYDAPSAATNTATSEPPLTPSVLVLHGWNDPLSPPEALTALASELTARKLAFEIHAYGHTGHSFTQPKAQAPERGMAFSAAANRRAFAALEGFLAEIFDDAATAGASP